MYPLPRIEDTLASLSGDTFFTTLDAQSGFYQIPMTTKSDMEKTAFRCERGTFEFTRLHVFHLALPMDLIASKYI